MFFFFIVQANLIDNYLPSPIQSPMLTRPIQPSKSIRPNYINKFGHPIVYECEHGPTYGMVRIPRFDPNDYQFIQNL